MHHIDIDAVPSNCKRIIVKRGGSERVIECGLPHDPFCDSIRSFYERSDEHWRAVCALVRRTEAAISLRLLDWLCANYSYTRRVVYTINGQPFHLHRRYKAALSSWTKARFDVFARTSKVLYVRRGCGGRVLTSAAQLNFVRWTIQNGVLDYAQSHAGAIEEDMLQTARQRAAQRLPNHRVRARTPPITIQTYTPPEPIVLVGGHPPLRGAPPD